MTYFGAFVVLYLTCRKMLRIYKYAYEIRNIEYTTVCPNYGNMSEGLLEYKNVTKSG